MRMHDLIAMGVAAARQRKRWTQEDTARAFRDHGLTNWRTGTVGSLEAGLRRPKLDEVLLMCAALEVTLEHLIPDTGQPVELGKAAELSAETIRALIAGGATDLSREAGHSPNSAETPSDAERHIARRLAVGPAEIRRASRTLWGRAFAEERDARIGDASELAPRSMQARRGLVTRTMIADLRSHLGGSTRA